MRLSDAVTAAVIAASGAFSACMMGKSADAGGSEPAVIDTETHHPAARRRGTDGNDGSSMSPHGPSEENSGMRSGFWSCPDLGAWPEAAECIGDERTHQNARLARALEQLAEALDDEDWTRAVNAQRSWIRLQEADRAFEDLLFAPLDQAGDFESGSNEVLRICARATQIHWYVELANSDPAPGMPPATCAEPPSRCADNRADGQESRLVNVFENLKKLVDGDRRQQLEASQSAWIESREANAELEELLSPHAAGSGTGLHDCTRAQQLERYALVAG